MATEYYIKVTNADEWSYKYTIKDNIIHIGANNNNDITLKSNYGTGVDDRHLQVICGLGNKGYRLVNLANSDIVVVGKDPIKPFRFQDVMDQTEVVLGDFRLVFHGQSGTTDHKSSSNSSISSNINSSSTSKGPIEIEIDVNETDLTVHKTIEGKLVGHNHGQKKVQFDLEVLDNFPKKSYELLALNHIYRRGTGETSLKLKHSQESKPKAGPYLLRIRATAPDDYPGESHIAEKLIEIAPFFKFSLNLKPIG